MSINIGNKSKFTTLIVLLIILLTAGIISGVWYLNNLSNKENVEHNTQSLIASGVVPHHLLAKEIVQDFFEHLSSKENPKTIILLSPDHFKSGNISREKSFITLDSKTEEFNGLKVDNILLENLSNKTKLVFNNSFVSLEHGITNLLPYIEKYFPDTKVLPILIPSEITEEQIIELIETINIYSSPQTIIIASVDFSHYLPKKVAEFHDVKSIRVLLNFEDKNFKNLEVDCWQCLYGARLFAKLQENEFYRIIAHNKNSSDFFKKSPSEETTSYFSVVFEKGSIKESKEIKNFDGKTILFVGDIMLDREVEKLILKNSVFYPFKKISQVLRGVDTLVGNLEGPIVENPPNFSDNSLKFAFSSNVIRGLAFSNFNLLSLANNHTFDMGEDGFKETKEFLKKANINFAGNPIKCDEDFLFEKDNIIYLAFNKIFPFSCSDEKIIEIIRMVRKSNPEKFLIVICHWGEEYQTKSSLSQQKLAHQIIDAGSYLIIGSHPHVVQEIEEYKGKLIFYSLGNFIFDQNFLEETQQGLIVGLEIYPTKLIYRIFPIKSYLSQPSLMKKKEAGEFLRELALRSSSQLLSQIENGIIEHNRN